MFIIDDGGSAAKIEFGKKITANNNPKTKIDEMFFSTYTEYSTKTKSQKLCLKLFVISDQTNLKKFNVILTSKLDQTL